MESVKLKLILFFLFITSVFGEKRRSEVVDVTDVKEWKKLVKSRGNVLLYFAFDVDYEMNSLLVEAAETTRTFATIAKTDCNGGGKKLCKKLKVSSSVLRHFHNGELNVDYNRAKKLSAFVNFLKDPKGDLPWEEDESAKAVTHIPDTMSVYKLLKKESSSGRGILIMFYTPWCGYCKRLKPAYSQAAEELGSDYILAALNVEENPGAKQKFNITGFPTLIYYKDGKDRGIYSGENDKESLVRFMKNPTAPPPPKEPEIDWATEMKSVVHLDDETFPTFIQENPSALVMFYAPWCGYCKKIKPEYIKAAETLLNKKIEGKLGAVDSTKSSVGGKYKVEGFPTLKYFKDGEFAFDVRDARDEASLVKFMMDPKEPPPPEVESAWADEESSVVHLNEETFKQTLRKKKHALVMFYAPWCGHCKAAKPEFTSAAEEVRHDFKALLGAVDCTKHESLCGMYDVKGFPTFKYFQYFKDVRPYDGPRKASDFVEVVQGKFDDWMKNEL